MQDMTVINFSKTSRRFMRILFSLLMILVFFTACSQATDNPTANTKDLAEIIPSETAMPTEVAQTTTPNIPEIVSTPTQATFEDSIRTAYVCVPSNHPLSPRLQSEIMRMINREPMPSLEEPCTLIKAGNDHPVGEMVLALVAPFPTVQDEVSVEELKGFWQGGESENFNRLILYPYVLDALTWLWGEPVGSVEVFDRITFKTPDEKGEYYQSFMKEVWTSERTWAIIAFEELNPRWKVIALDGQSPIHKSFDSEQYALTIPLTLYNEDATRLQDTIEYMASTQFEDLLPFSNYDSEKLTTVILTGVTAMARATAVGMDERGILVPGEDLADVLKEADILHISNEVPFAENCPKQSSGGYLVFCSPESYMELLRSIGTNVVELTGDHFQDYGSEAMLFTLDLYAKEGWPVYGGGKDIFDARAPIKLEVNGNKIAFLGCNAKSPNFAQASETSTGAYHCDMDYMEETVRQLRHEGYLPIVTFQHEEVYTWSPNAQMIRDFGRVLEAGAVIASGSQAHQPHYAEFVHDGFAHYGLGNLFFDQYGVAQYTDWGFIDRHVFYYGRHISTELLTIRFLDKVKATWATPEQRAEMLEIIFDTSRMWWPGTEPWRQE